MPVGGRSAAVTGGRLLDLLEPRWRRELAAGVPAAGLDVAPDLPSAAATALGERSRALTGGETAERWPACVVVALAHVAASAGTRSFWPAWHRAAGLRASRRSAGEWGSTFLAALGTLGLPASGPAAEDAVLAHAVAGGREGQDESEGHGETASLRLDPFGGGVLRVDAASGQARPVLPEDALQPEEAAGAGGRLLAFDTDGTLVGRVLPAEAVWALYPATAELRSDVQLRIVVTSTLPLTWHGWRLVQVDLRNASWVALSDSGAEPTGADGERRVVRGRTKPVLRTGAPIPGVTTLTGENVYSVPPKVLLPPGRDRWRVEARRAGTGTVLASVEPAEAVISVPPGMTVSPPAVAYREETVRREVTCVAGPVVQRLAVTPPHIRLRVDPEPGSGGTATPWHHAGPLRLTSDDLWRGGALRIDLPGVLMPPPVTVTARSTGQAAGEPVQVLAPTRDGRYPLRRILDTVTVYGHAELTITIATVSVTIATVSGASQGNDPWAMT